MKINIKVMTPVAYVTLQKNYKEVYRLMKEHPDDGSWVKEYLGFDPYETKTYKIDDFSLNYDDDYSVYAEENAIKLYETLKTIPSNVLYSMYFWSWICFEKAYKQAQQCVKLTSAETLKSIWFPEFASRRAIMRGPLSREFIKVKMSINEDADSPYELTESLLLNRSLYDQFCYRNISDLETVSRASIRIEGDIYKKTNYHLSMAQCSYLMKIAFKLGSVMLADTLTEDEVYLAMFDKFAQEYPNLLN